MDETGMSLQHQTEVNEHNNLDYSNEFEEIPSDLVNGEFNDSNSEEENYDGMPDLEDIPKKLKKKKNSQSNQNNTKMDGDKIPSDNKLDQKIEKMEEKEQMIKGERCKEDDYLDVLGNGLLLKKVLVEGDSKGGKPANGEVVTIRYKCCLSCGKEVEEDEIRFTLGDQEVVNALDLGVAMMCVGQKIELITDARYAYGSTGKPPHIPPESKLTYTIELLKREPAIDIYTLNPSERLELGEKKRLHGNELVSRKDFSGAIYAYTSACTVLNPDGAGVSFSAEPDKLQLLLDCRVKCLNNLGLCQLKMECFDAAIKSCLEVLQLQPGNAKASYRVSKAYHGKGQLNEAVKYMKTTIRLEPDSKQFLKELNDMTQKLKKEAKQEQKMYRKMFGEKPLPTNVNSNKPSKKESSAWVAVGLGTALAVVLLGVGLAYRQLH